MKIYLSFALPIFTCFLFGQSNLNDYKGLYPKAPIPKEFTQASYDKYLAEIETNKALPKDQRIEKEFLVSSIYEIDRSLFNGSVVFNDPVTIYLKKILDSLLVNEQDLRSKLRVYTLKSTEANAFSTRQGILFVTTGLISKINTEAELAFIIAHEISHFTENHVLLGYNQTKEIRKRKGKYKFADKGKRLKELSSYSQPKEFEADDLGFKILSSSNYNNDASLSALHILLSSHLPASNHVFDPKVLDDDALFIPESYYLDSVPPLVFDEEYDDKKSSHPNIHKRKEKIKEALANFKGKKSASKDFLNDPKEFEYIKNICRLESVKLEVEKGFPLKAIYMMSVLKKDFPNCEFLDEYHAKAWYKFVLYANNKRYGRVFLNPKGLEGESARLHNIIKHLDAEMISSIALKNLYKIHKETGGKNATINRLWRNALKNTVFNKLIKFDELKKVNYHDAKKEHDSLLVVRRDSLKALGEDTKTQKVQVISASSTRGNINYERGSKKSKLLAKFDEDTFWEYAFSDLLNEEEFNLLLDTLKTEIESVNFRGVRKRGINYHNFDEYEVPKVSLGSDELLVASPIFYFSHEDEFDHIKSELNSNYALKAIEAFAMNKGVKTIILDRLSMQSDDVQGFKDLNEVNNYFFESARLNFDPIFLSTNMQVIEDIGERRKLNYALVPFISRDFNKGIDFYFVIYDIKNHTIASEYNRRYNFSYNSNEKYLGNRINEILSVMLGLE